MKSSAKRYLVAQPIPSLAASDGVTGSLRGQRGGASEQARQLVLGFLSDSFLVEDAV